MLKVLNLYAWLCVQQNGMDRVNTTDWFCPFYSVAHTAMHMDLIIWILVSPYYSFCPFHSFVCTAMHMDSTVWMLVSPQCWIHSLFHYTHNHMHGFNTSNHCICCTREQRKMDRVNTMEITTLKVLNPYISKYALQLWGPYSTFPTLPRASRCRHYLSDNLDCFTCTHMKCLVNLGYCTDHPWIALALSTSDPYSIWTCGMDMWIQDRYETDTSWNTPGRVPETCIGLANINWCGGVHMQGA